MININDMIKCYNSNTDFKDYVDRCKKAEQKDTIFVLQEVIVQQYYEYINKIGAYDETKAERI